MNGYIVFYQNKRLEVYAETTYEAQQQVIKQLKVPRSKQYLVTVMLAEKNAAPGQPGEQVTHTAVD